jgi:hypothetical protein
MITDNGSRVIRPIERNAEIANKSGANRIHNTCATIAEKNTESLWITHLSNQSNPSGGYSNL